MLESVINDFSNVLKAFPLFLLNYVSATVNGNCKVVNTTLTSESRNRNFLCSNPLNRLFKNCIL